MDFSLCPRMSLLQSCRTETEVYATSFRIAEPNFCRRLLRASQES